MKPVSSWSFRPYTPLDRPERANNPYVCRIVPGENSFEVEFFDNGAKDGAAHTLHCRARGEVEYVSVALGASCKAALDGLLPETDYEFYIERSDGARSETRLVRTGKVYGDVANYLHPEDDAYLFSGRYLCSPCLCKLPSGRLLSSMDVFEANNGQNLTMIFCSDDGGESWHYLSELFPCFWGQMFYEGGRLYMLGVSNEYGDLLIGASDDEPRTERNVLSLYRSPDLIDWECVCDLIDEKYADPKVVGFQYVSALIDGEDIIFLCRTSYGKPHNFHDSNYQTFHRIKNFRDIGKE